MTELKRESESVFPKNILFSVKLKRETLFLFNNESKHKFTAPVSHDRLGTSGSSAVRDKQKKIKMKNETLHYKFATTKKKFLYIKPEYSCVAAEFMFAGLVAVSKRMQPMYGSIPHTEPASCSWPLLAAFTATSIQPVPPLPSATPPSPALSHRPLLRRGQLAS